MKTVRACLPNKAGFLSAQVSDRDFPLVRGFNWRITFKYNNRPYVYTFDPKSKKHIYLHRLILNPVDSEEVDHKNNDSLDNRRENLRLASRQQNSFNIGKRKGKFSSRFKGVSRVERLKKWYVSICFNGKTIPLGHYSDEKIAARVYDKEARRLFGDFAHLNGV